MANNDDRNDSRWVDERLEVLKTPHESEHDVARARARLGALQAAPERRTRAMWIGVVVVTGLGLMALPWPRALAQELWNRLLLGRVAVVQVDGEDVSEEIAAVFAMDFGPFDQEPVASAAEAERVAGFWPALPSAGVVKGAPELSVVKRVTLATKPLKTSDIARALSAAGVTDLTVPKEWEGLMLIADAGPVVVAAYDDVEIMQFAAFRMNTPPGFQFGRFMEMAFRVFGRGAAEAKTLGAKFEANPALVVHFPERAPVRDVALRSGPGIIVGDFDGDDTVCFFWNTHERIFIASATHTDERSLVAMADSIVQSRR
jgi:hypothetical protein